MFARTQRLLLRPGFPEDAPALLAAIGDERVARKVARMPWPYAIEDAEQFLAGFDGDHVTKFLVFERSAGSPVLVGGCGFEMRGDGSTHLGYWVRPDRWGRGIATEGTSAMIDIIRSFGVRRVEAGHFVDNPASGRVLVKLGFRPTGRMEKTFSRGRGREVSTRMMRLDLDDDMEGAIAA